MFKRNNIIYVFICIITCIVILMPGCNRREYCPFPVDIDLEYIPPLTSRLKIDIFYDASYSMVGFVTPSNSYYVRALQLLERSFISGWPESKNKDYQYYQFGTSINKISREKAFNAVFEEFYKDPAYTGETRIENVIEKMDRTNLTIIVTDLFQNASDVNLLIGKLNEKVLHKDVSIGILGIKSQFNGKVFDVGLERFNFTYFTIGKDPNQFRPFYILMIGKYTDIIHYYKMMEVNGLNNFPKKNFLILSPQLMENLDSLKHAKIIKKNKIKLVRNILKSDNLNRFVNQFNVQNNSSNPYFDISIELSFLDYMPNFNSQNIDVEATAWQWKKNSENQKIKSKNENKKTTENKKFVDSIDALRGVSIKNKKILDSNLNFRTEVIPKNLPVDGIYCFKIIFRLPSYSYLLPNWISQWDMDQNLFSYWQQEPERFQGNTTLNLKNFLTNIWHIIYQKHKPKIAEFYFFIKKG